MYVWAVANQKGGVGKTTTTVTLASLLGLQGESVLVVDMDPHGSLSSYFGCIPEDVENSVYSLFQAGVKGEERPLASVVHPTEVQGISLLPASTALATLDRQLSEQAGMGLVLRRALERGQKQFQHVFVDCPPVFGILMLNALAACSSLLIPVQTEYLALKGLERMLHTLEMVGRSRRAPLEHLIVPTLYDRRTRAGCDSLAALRKRYTDTLWDGVIPIDTKFRDASQLGRPLPEVLPDSRGVLAYAELLETLSERYGCHYRKAG